MSSPVMPTGLPPESQRSRGMTARLRQLQEAMRQLNMVRQGREDFRPGMKITGELDEEKHVAQSRTALQRQLDLYNQRGY